MFNNISIIRPSSNLPQEIFEKTENLANNLSLALVDEVQDGLGFEYTKEGLGLYGFELKGKKSSKNNLIYVDFVQGKNGHRYKNNCTTKQPIAKAVGIKSGFRPTIFDATAGLGGDSFVLACLGCVVDMCERSKFLHALLEDGLHRAQKENYLANIVSKMNLVKGNSQTIIENNKFSYHTIYMDPMYPHKTKSALNKQEMRVIRSLVGDDDDSESLLNCALKKAENRVVVKRPKGAPYISTLSPSHKIVMKNSRFDVYLVSGI
ncbi:MAG: class I SAM-dependent methyltransferase [Desulfotalea sp.]